MSRLGARKTLTTRGSDKISPRRSTLVHSRFNNVKPRGARVWAQVGSGGLRWALRLDRGVHAQGVSRDRSSSGK